MSTSLVNVPAVSTAGPVQVSTGCVGVAHPVAWFFVPPHDQDEFLRLPESVQVEINTKLKIFEQLSKADNVKKACEYYGSQFANERGYSPARLSVQYYDYLNSNANWRILINKAKVPRLARRDVGLPEEFLEFVGALFDNNQRDKCRTAHRKLIRMWRSGHEDVADGGKPVRIPGYGTWREWFMRTYPTEPVPSTCPHELPEGWSYENLLRKARAPKVERTLVQLGTAAALKLLPGVPGTRRGARPLEFVFFDDVHLDRKVMVNGYREPVRLLQLGALDYASGVYLRFGQRPELPTDEGKRERLKERDMKWIVAMVLEDWGYPADYDMHLICERGTATLREADARALYDLSGGRIKVCLTTMEGELVLAWEERAKGNPRGKASLESWHNLFHNEYADIRGQIGKDRDHSPAALQGMERNALALSDATAFLTPEQRARLNFPFPDKDQAHFETLDVVDRINNRRQHNLEGFDQVLEWRLKGTKTEFRPEAELANVQLPREVLENAIEWNARVETPIERLRRLVAGVQFIKIPAGILPRFYEDCHKIDKVEAGQFTFQHEGKTYIYRPASAEDAIPDGTELMGYYRPQYMDSIHFTKDGAYVATWHLVRKVRRGDQDALSQEIRHKQIVINTHMANVRRRHADVIEAEHKKQQQNLEVLTEAGLVPSIQQSPVAMDCTTVATPTASALQAAVQAHDEQKRQEQEQAQKKINLSELARKALRNNAKEKE